MRSFVIAGTHSGCGKTTISLGLMAALAQRGLSVQPFKTGPDFIDSGLHKLATGRASRNLDLWMCGNEYVKRCFAAHATASDVAVVEGVMGLYDGDLSTAVLAATLDLPVVLVVDGYGMAESAGPVVKGFKEWGSTKGKDQSVVRGVIFNRVASEHHYERLRAAVQDVPVLGYLPRDVHFEIPHRHLGLVVAEELPVSAANLARLAETITANMDVDRLLEMAEEPSIGPISQTGPTRPVNNTISTRSGSVRIAIAADRAFCFYYQDNIDLLQEAGAEVLFFSPLKDTALPADIDAVYLGGGYPELYATQLSENRAMRTSVRAWIESGGSTYAECGGLMYLSRSIRDFDNVLHDMAGVFPFRTVMTRGRAHLGYREVTFAEDCLIGSAGSRARGHEFHYSQVDQGETATADRIYSMTNGSGKDLGPEGYHHKNTVGSYVHIHFGSSASIARSFVRSVQTRKKTNDKVSR
jgi:cobyrinic acid a,c-diamide synthase